MLGILWLNSNLAKFADQQHQFDPVETRIPQAGLNCLFFTMGLNGIARIQQTNGIHFPFSNTMQIMTHRDWFIKPDASGSFVMGIRYSVTETHAQAHFYSFCL